MRLSPVLDIETEQYHITCICLQELGITLLQPTEHSANYSG